jgi:hypothetical protein
MVKIIKIALKIAPRQIPAIMMGCVLQTQVKTKRIVLMIVGHPVVIEMVSVKAKMAKILSLVHTIVVVIMMERVNQNAEKILYRAQTIANHHPVMKMAFANLKMARMKPIVPMIAALCHLRPNVITTMYAIQVNIGQLVAIVLPVHLLILNITMWPMHAASSEAINEEETALVMVMQLII